MGQEKIITLIKEFKARAAKKARLEKIILFGSRAKGTAWEGSDVDLLLISKDFQGLKYSKRSPPFYLLWQNDYNVDIICLSPKEFEQKRKEIGVVQEAANEGLVI